MYIYIWKVASVIIIGAKKESFLAQDISVHITVRAEFISVPSMDK